MLRPKISVNLAMSLDGKIATTAYTPARFSTKADFEKLLELRASADALIVGKGTLDVDTMSLMVPKELLKKGEGAPKRCVISNTGNWCAEHPLFRSDFPEIILYTTGKTKVEIPNATHVEDVSLEEVILDLYARGVRHLHCEGGGELIQSLFTLNLVDKLYLTWVGSKLFGGAKAPTITGKLGNTLASTKMLRLTSCVTGSQGECFLEYDRINNE